MKKNNLFLAVGLLLSVVTYAQTAGINTSTPNPPPLDVIGRTTDGSKPEGLKAPRLDEFMDWFKCPLCSRIIPLNDMV